MSPVRRTADPRTDAQRVADQEVLEAFEAGEFLHVPHETITEAVKACRQVRGMHRIREAAQAVTQACSHEEGACARCIEMMLRGYVRDYEKSRERVAKQAEDVTKTEG